MTVSGQQRMAALAAEAPLHRAFRWLHLHELQLRRWQMTFLAVAAPPFGEAARARWFQDRFVEFGLEDTHLDQEGNVVARLPGEAAPSPGNAVLLSAHLDTVFPEGIDCVPREEGAVLHGPGACDNGAGLAALLGIAAALTHAGYRPPCPIVFTANVGEEGPGDLRGMRALFASPPFGLNVSAAIALEGAGTALVVDRALGSRRLQVVLTGPGGHSWADAGRPNPILALSAALLAIAHLPLPKSPRTVLSVGTIRGGTTVNSVPDRAEAELDLRSTSALELDRLELAVLHRITAEVEAEMQARPEQDRLQLRIERTGCRAPGYLPVDSPLRASLQAVDRHLGIQTELRIGSTDANLPLSRGVPALAIGAGGRGGGLHTLAEWYDPTGRELALRRILLLLLDMAGRVADENWSAHAGLKAQPAVE